MRYNDTKFLAALFVRELAKRVSPETIVLLCRNGEHRNHESFAAGLAGSYDGNYGTPRTELGGRGLGGGAMEGS